MLGFVQALSFPAGLYSLFDNLRAFEYSKVLTMHAYAARDGKNCAIEPPHLTRARAALVRTAPAPEADNSQSRTRALGNAPATAAFEHGAHISSLAGRDIVPAARNAVIPETQKVGGGASPKTETTGAQEASSVKSKKKAGVESFNVEWPESYTREDFAWPNALYAELIMTRRGQTYAQR